MSVRIWFFLSSGLLVVVGLKKGLVTFEEHAGLNFNFFVEVEPSPVGGLFAFEAVDDDPHSKFYVVNYSGLHFWKKFVVYSDVAVWTSTDHKYLILVLAAVEVGSISLNNGEDPKF